MMTSIRFSGSGLPSDITIEVDDKTFYLHKFPLLSTCGKIAKLLEECSADGKHVSHLTLSDFPGGPDAFEITAKYCYGRKVELTPSNVVIVYCAAHYLEMTDEYEEGNLQSQAESFLHKVVLQNWKNCIHALRSCEHVLSRSEELQIFKKCTSALSMMACTDPSLFGWPMMMYGSLQSPGGSILWNGINTGARVRSSYSDWWYEDLTEFSLGIFEKVMIAMEVRGIRPENRAGAVVHYAKRYLPGLSRRHGSHARNIQSSKTKQASVSSVSDQKLLLETLERLLPFLKGSVSSRTLVALLRTSILVNATQTCRENLEKRIGIQLELATLDSLLIPNYSETVETLYDTDCVERILRYFLSSASENIQAASPPVMAVDSIAGSPVEDPLRKVAKIVDEYLIEIASDPNLKPSKFFSLAEALPASSRLLHDGLYRALDIYLKEHPWLSDTEKGQLCQIIHCQKLSMEACTHASQNERLPLRVVVQVLFFEQLQLRSAIAGCFHVSDQNVADLSSNMNPSGDGMEPQLGATTVQRSGWAAIIRQNQVLKVGMDNMKTRVGDLEQQFGVIKHEIEKLGKVRGAFSSVSLVLSKTIGCRPTKLNRQRSGVSVPPKSSATSRHVHNNNKDNYREKSPKRAVLKQPKHKRSFSLF